MQIYIYCRYCIVKQHTFYIIVSLVNISAVFNDFSFKKLLIKSCIMIYSIFKKKNWMSVYPESCSPSSALTKVFLLHCSMLNRSCWVVNVGDQVLMFSFLASLSQVPKQAVFVCLVSQICNKSVRECFHYTVCPSKYQIKSLNASSIRKSSVAFAW